MDQRMQEASGLNWRRAVGVVFCCTCLRKRGLSGKASVCPEHKKSRSAVVSHYKVTTNIWELLANYLEGK